MFRAVAVQQNPVSLDRSAAFNTVSTIACMIQTVLHEISAITGPIAWPLFAFVATYYFRNEVRDLIGRVRKGAGLEFDPATQTAAKFSEIPSGVAQPSLASAPPVLLSPTTLAFEASLAELPLVKAATAGADRESVLLRLFARSVLMAKFERIEGIIWKSQIDLLMHLDHSAEGESPGRLKEQFYAKAAALYPAEFSGYSFEGYISFLRNMSLLDIVGESIRISQEGKEYLAWRVEQARAPKVAG